MSLGVDIKKQGYNVYLAGAMGTGKTTLAWEILEDKAKKESPPPDCCYVHNFKNPDCPQAILLPAGVGSSFKKDLEAGIDRAIKTLLKSFESEEYEYEKNALLSFFVDETNRMYMQLDEEAHSYGFTISRNQNSINSVPLQNGEPLSQEEFMSLPEEERIEIMKKSAIIQEKLNQAFRHFKELEKSIKVKVKKLENETVRAVMAPIFADLFEKYRLFKDLVEQIEAIQEDLLANYEAFVQPEENSPLSLFRRIEQRNSLRRYQVNLIVDNSELKHAPVIFESNPTYANLFGQIEYEGEFGILATDFSKIKAGAIHRANGGYLILRVYDVVKNYYVWDALKRSLINQEIVVENLSRMLGISNTETLQPQPIPAKLKVVLIGEPLYYYLLYNWDEEFRRLFRIRADFDIEVEKSRKRIREYARFISSICRQEGLKHFDPQAVAAVVDYASRLAEDQNKISTMLNKVVEIVIEADCWANYARAELVGLAHVKKAIMEKKYRSSLLENKIQDMMAEESLIINVQGKRVGELNGLAVYEIGDYSFGKPVRITAKTFMGEKGLVNIEREIRMSGNIHSKGVLTLSGYLGAQYAREKPLTLSASLTFEQSYQGIEGDSASSAELFALLSSLADLPIKQGIAVTGSVNQNGEIQPVGGINQKIEGFFRICQMKGLDGEQGVIIPRKNLSQLMLEEELLEAVKKRQFSIWAIEDIDEGLEILTGKPAGKREENGRFSPDSVHALVDQRLKEWSSKKRRDIAFPDRVINADRHRQKSKRRKSYG
ncbi:AAA family ATPase [Syntrophomonas sp.]|uniref:Lon protease family protein n=1 Tax=Syntrophomonas sp. TaxID=2053627 RepID=UPI00345A0D7E